MSNRQSRLNTIATLLREQSTVALATVDEEGCACVAPLYYIADEALTLYWLSAAGSEHSINVERTQSASATVYRHAEKWREICGVQMRGTVAAIMEKGRREALIQMYCERFQLGALFRLPISRCVLYAFQPEFIRYLDNSKRLGYKFEITL